jgi:hypothetical protein
MSGLSSNAKKNRFFADEYVDFDNVMMYDTLYSMFMAGIMFVALLQLFQPMDFSSNLKTLKASQYRNFLIFRKQLICNLIFVFYLMSCFLDLKKI